jgi:hypothetical protein
VKVIGEILEAPRSLNPERPPATLSIAAARDGKVEDFYIQKGFPHNCTHTPNKLGKLG